MEDSLLDQGKETAKDSLLWAAGAAWILPTPYPGARGFNYPAIAAREAG